MTETVILNGYHLGYQFAKRAWVNDVFTVRYTTRIDAHIATFKDVKYTCAQLLILDMFLKQRRTNMIANNAGIGYKHYVFGEPNTLNSEKPLFSLP